MHSLYCSKSASLKGKRIGLCVTGSIAAVETVKLARELRRHGAEVHPIMSRSAKDIIHPNALSFATGNDVIETITGKVEHVLLAGDSDSKADLILVCPCTMNTLSKIALGVADTAPTLFVATGISHIPVMLVPTMHQTMFESRIVQDHLAYLKSMGVKILHGLGEEGKIKMPSTERIVFEVKKTLSENDLFGKSALVSAGPTIERIDDVRFISNKSTGKMGIAIAEELEARGAKVRLALGRTSESSLVSDIVRRESYGEMYEEILNGKEHDIYVLSMAASDFKPEKTTGKISSEGNVSLELSPNKKIISDLRERTNAFIVGFKAEHSISEEELIERAKSSLKKNNADMVVANDVGREKRGFEHDTNEVYIVSKDGTLTHLPLSSKREIAKGIVDEMARNINT